MLQYEVNHTQQEDYNGDLIDPMHHFYIDITGSRGVLLPEEVSSHFPQRKELLSAAFLIMITCVICLHGLS